GAGPQGPAEGAHRAAGGSWEGNVPDAHGLVLTGRGDELPVGAEGHAVDLLMMAAQLQELFPAGGVPDAHDAVVPACGEAPAVGGIRHAAGAGGEVEGPHGPAGVGVADQDAPAPVPAGEGEVPAFGAEGRVPAVARVMLAGRQVRGPFRRPAEERLAPG